MESREMVQELRALAVLEEDLCSVPSTHKVAHNHLLQQFQGNLTPSSGFYLHCMHMVHLHACRRNTLIK